LRQPRGWAGFDASGWRFTSSCGVIGAYRSRVQCPSCAPFTEPVGQGRRPPTARSRFSVAPHPFRRDRSHWSPDAPDGWGETRARRPGAQPDRRTVAAAAAAPRTPRASSSSGIVTCSTCAFISSQGRGLTCYLEGCRDGWTFSCRATQGRLVPCSPG
jgi:hypothetical protein